MKKFKQVIGLSGYDIADPLRRGLWVKTANQVGKIYVIWDDSKVETLDRGCPIETLYITVELCELVQAE